MSCRSRFRVNGCSGSSDCAEFFRTNATPTACGPALTGTRVRSRLSSVSFVSARFVSDSLLSSVAANRRREHAHAVDADLELMRPLEPRHVTHDVLQQDDVEFVGGVEREVVADEDAAARAERQAFDVIGLSAVRRHAVDGAHRRRRRIADREGADACARRSGIARAGTATPSARPQCCRTRSPRRRPAAAPWRRCRARARREPRRHIPSGSADEEGSGRGWASRAPRDRARFRATWRRRRASPRRAAAFLAAASCGREVS